MPSDLSFLALVPSGAADALGDACDELDARLEVASSASGLFECLGDGPWTATILSFSVDAVDESVAARVAGEAAAGRLLLSAPGASLQRALIMERTGALALLREPLDAGTLVRRLSEVLEEGKEVPLPETSREEERGPPDIVGSASAMAEVFEVVARVADAEATVLLTGESGTGKELVARAIHRASGRSDGPFVAVNCAAIPGDLLESELFGHERGAFTGAVARKKGRFERADGGTLFLDEIGDMSLPLQGKILRALEERAVERVGGEETISLDVRVLAATNRALDGAIEEGAFREDLYFRLAVVEVELPPLREREGDVRELALHFAARFAARHDRPTRAITQEALRRLEAHGWPGNVRELRNVMDRAVLLAPGPVIGAGDLRLGAGSPRISARGREEGSGAGYPPTLSLEEVEAEHIRRVLEHTGGHMIEAAEILGIHRNTLTRKVREYGIEVQGR